jgi:hypothetical protein
VSFDTGGEKDATILELQQAAETARENLETEKKKVEGKSPLSDFLSVAWVRRDPLSTYLSFAFRPAGCSRDVNNAGGGAPGGLQLLPVETRGSA